VLRRRRSDAGADDELVSEAAVRLIIATTSGAGVLAPHLRDVLALTPSRARLLLLRSASPSSPALDCVVRHACLRAGRRRAAEQRRSGRTGLGVAGLVSADRGDTLGGRENAEQPAAASILAPSPPLRTTQTV
jgi:hypothetical protein